MNNSLYAEINTEQNILLVIFCFVCYFIGSIPWGVLIAKLIGSVDIKKVGSGNIGAANVGRVLGKKYGFLVFVLDALKGFFCTVFVSFIFLKIAKTELLLVKTEIFYSYLFGFFSVFGHIFSCFLNFKGGKGVATAVGAFCVLLPGVILIALGIWALILSLSGYISVASLLSALSLPLIRIFTYKNSLRFSQDENPGLECTIVLVTITVFIIYKHKDNIVRLMKKEEYNVWENKIKR